MEPPSPPVQQLRSAVIRYGLAPLCVIAALGPALLLQHYRFHDVELPLFLFGVALAAWHGGLGPAVLAIVLSVLAFDYFFTEPLYSFYFTLSDLPAVFVLAAFAALIAWFSSVRRHAEAKLLQARDQLSKEVVERSQQASLLNLTHDTIFVRDMSDMITYWNRGAQELYGWDPNGGYWKTLACNSCGRSSRYLSTTSNRRIAAHGPLGGRTRRQTKADGSALVVASRWSLRRDEQERPAAPSWKPITTLRSVRAGKRKFAV